MTVNNLNIESVNCFCFFCFVFKSTLQKKLIAEKNNTIMKSGCVSFNSTKYKVEEFNFPRLK